MNRADWLLIVFWLALLCAALAFALVIGAGVVWLIGRAFMAVWPWVQAHSDQLTLGLAIGIAIGAVVALAMEDGRR